MVLVGSLSRRTANHDVMGPRRVHLRGLELRRVAMVGFVVGDCTPTYQLVDPCAAQLHE